MLKLIELSHLLFLFFIISQHLHTVEAIECFQCDSNSNLECAELFDESSTALKAHSCSAIHEARFCIKSTGIFSGQIGTMRNCSSRDLGNYCTYLKRLGDDRPTRSCIFTCSSDGCNSAMSTFHSYSLIAILLLCSSIFTMLRI